MGKTFIFMALLAVGLTPKGCGMESSHTPAGTKSMAAPEVVTFTVLQAPLRARFALRNPAARAAFTGAFFTLNCTNTAGQPVTPGVLIITQADRVAALQRLSNYDISHVVELGTPWAPRQVVEGEMPLEAGIAQCGGMTMKGAW